MLRFSRSPEEFALHTDAAGTAPPEAFGPFRVLHQIGAGALGPVFRAFDPDHDRLVAVKAFRLDLAPERVHRLVADFERLIAAGLTHPSATAPLAAGIEGVTAYLAQQYAAADSLDITLRQGPVSIADSLRISTQIAGALDAGAALHMLHGVLHPRDVLLAGDETKLTGLGIARAVERVGLPPQIRRPYTAPERGGSGGWDRRADVFGLAAITHEMLWGRRIAATGEEAAAALTEIAGSDLSQLRTVFARALAEDPAARFETAGEFVGALSAACQQPVARLPRARLEADTTAEELEGPPLLLYEPESIRFAVIESEPAPAPALETEPEPEVVLRVIDGQMAPVLPLERIETYQHGAPESVPGETRSRSAISPLAFALLIGGAIGFVAGFGLGTWGRSPDAAPLASDSSIAANTTTATTGPGRDFTEATIDREVRSKPDPRSADSTSPGSTSPGPTSPSRTTEQKTAAAPVVGTLLVRSTPLGARVVVDGRDYGRTPVTVGNLSRGAHKVRIARDGYVPDDRQVTVTPVQRTHSITVRLAPERVAPVQPAVVQPPPAPAAAPLTIESRPPGATVFLDGHLVGTTPVVVPEVAGGNHAIYLDREGYRRWSSTIHIVTTDRNRVTASLER